MCVHQFPDDGRPGQEVVCLDGALHGTGGARRMVEHRITHWNLSAEDAVLSFAGWFNGYLYAMLGEGAELVLR